MLRRSMRFSCLTIWQTLPALGLAGGLSLLVGQAGEMDDAIRALRAVGAEGQGNEAARAAWQVLAAREASALPEILRGMQGVSKYAGNWFRLAVESIVARERQSGHALPAVELGQFVLEITQDPQARHLAFSLLQSAEPETAARLLPGLLQDPASELRREAVSRVQSEAAARLAAGDRLGATLLFRQALGAAREVDQIEALAKSLRELGQSVDLRETLGFIREWQVIGPFDNTGMKGLSAEFPPEKQVDLAVELDGKKGKVRWAAAKAKDDYGMIDLNAACGKSKEVVAYAYHEFNAESARPAELRLGSENAWKLWVNGQLVFSRNEYHRGREIDQYRLPINLHAGRNTLLVKVCQDAAVEEWTEEWQFQLRITDTLGTPVREAPAGGSAP